MTLKGFESAFDEEEKTRPLPGTMAHLMWVEEQKKQAAVNKSVEYSQTSNDAMPSDGQTPSNGAAPSGGLTPLKKVTRLSGVMPSGGLIPSGGVLPSDGHTPPVDKDLIILQLTHKPVEITKNYMRFDKDVFTVLATLPDVECKVYLDLIRRSWGQLPAMRGCKTTFKAISSSSGVSIGRSMARAIQNLESRGLIEIMYKARAKGEQSVYRVYLPKETGSYETSSTEYRFKNQSTGGITPSGG